ncbi:MAG: biosynthetic arginine decarboxylase [Puniceicoccales bacterium]
MTPDNGSARWTSEDSAALYGVREWGGGYFDVSEDGDVVLCPNGESNGSRLSLPRIVEGLRKRGISMPVLLRFPELLDRQIHELNSGFGEAIREYSYGGKYRGVYPVKVNQQEQVIDEVCTYGARYGHGLEAGSKAELIAALAYLKNPGDLLICNGYKDERFIELGLYARRIGIDCVFVIETPIEVDLIIATAERLGIRPKVGVRVRLSSCGSGHWKDSGGDRSVFGLNAGQLMDCVDRFKEAGYLDCLQLLHYHLGSQVPDIRDIRTSLTEACRVYVGLIQEGAPMGTLDIGGGLAIDYEGSQSKSGGSRNYTIQEYCRDVIETVKNQMDLSGVEHPNIVSESGRATVAYYSVLLVDVLDVNRFEPDLDESEVPENAHYLIRNSLEVGRSLCEENLQECYNDAFYYRDEIRQLFQAGAMGLRERSLGEKIFWDNLSKIWKRCSQMEEDDVAEELLGLESFLADIYYGNFSLFQSLPDAWAIDQVFPVVPIERLNEEPTRRAILSDITCDCDGKVDRFVESGRIRRTLAVHEPKEKEKYILGAFLVGAYQETLGDLHNLLGDTHVVSVRMGKGGDFEVDREIEGDSVADVLSYVEYDPKQVSARFRASVERAVRSGDIDADERRFIVKTFEDTLRGYTYFEE